MYISPLLFILSIHLEQAMAETANTKRLHKAFLNPEAVLRMVFIWLTGTIFTDEAVGALVGALRSLPPRDAAEEPETLEPGSRAFRCQKARWLRSSQLVSDLA